MSRSVDLPDSVFSALEEAASICGTTPAEWIATQLPDVQPAPEPRKGSPTTPLAERVPGRGGRFRSGASRGGAGQAIHVSGDVYRKIEAAASASGTTPADWIAARVPEPALVAESSCNRSQPRTLAERFEGYLGTVDTGETDLAERHSELFADGMEEKHRAGRL